MDYSHLDALNLRLSHERVRYEADKSPLRKVWVEQIEREIAGEYERLGLSPETINMSDDELLNELIG